MGKFKFASLLGANLELQSPTPCCNGRSRALSLDSKPTGFRLKLPIRFLLDNATFTAIQVCFMLVQLLWDWVDWSCNLQCGEIPIDALTDYL